MIYHWDEHLVPSEGVLQPDLFFIVDVASASAEMEQRAAGHKTRAVLKKLAERYEFTFYLTNLVKVHLERRPRKKLLGEALDLLLWEIEWVQPKAIVVFGKELAQTLISGFQTLREDHGTIFRYQLESGEEIPIVPTFKLESVWGIPSLQEYFAHDIYRACKHWALTGPPSYSVVTADDLDLIFSQQPSKSVYLDIETTGVSLQDKVLQIGINFKDDPNDHTYIILQPTPLGILELGRLLASRHVIGHNVSFDLALLKANSPDLDITSLKTSDTMQMAHILGEDVLSLKHLTSVYTDLPGSHSGGGYEDPTYLAEDLRSTRAIHLHFSKAYRRPITDTVNRAVPFVAEMRVRGTYIDRQRILELRDAAVAKLEDDLNALREAFPVVQGVNWKAPGQVVDALLANGIPLTEQTDSGKYTAKESALLALGEKFPLVRLLLTYRETDKLITGFLDGYYEISKYDSCLHPSLMLQGTRTGRLSCRNPNLQQVPRTGPLKTIFQPREPEGHIGLVDLSQAELRAACLITNDDALYDALMSEDVHRMIASWVWNKPKEDITAYERKKSKLITFGVLYGGSVHGLKKKLDLPASRVEAVMANFFDKMPVLSAWLKACERKAFNGDYEIKTPFGRSRNVRDIAAMESPRGAYRKIVNTPTQSTASDIMLNVLVYVAEHLKGHRSHPLFPVHDSLIMEIYPGELDLVREIVQDAFKSLWETPLANYPMFQKLPFTGELVIGKSWAQVESTNEGYDPIISYPCSTH